MSARVCLAIDSACDLPQSFINSHPIRVLPINLIFGESVYHDTRDPVSTINMYKSQRLEKDFNATSEPASVEEIGKLIENDIATQYDNVLAITISSTRSDIFRNVRESIFVSSQRLKELRKQSGNKGAFKVKVLDSGCLFTGQGVLVYEAVRLLEENQLSFQEIIRHIDRLKPKVKGFLVPESLYYLKNRASAKGDKSVGWLSYQIGSVMDIKPIIQAYKGETLPIGRARGFDQGLQKIFTFAKEAMANGLSIPAINMSYAGNPAVIKKNPHYQAFVKHAQEQGIATLLSVMSTTAAVNVGPGAFSLAFAEK